MQDWRDAGQVCCRTGGMHERMDAVKEGCRTGGMQDRREAGVEGIVRKFEIDILYLSRTIIFIVSHHGGLLPGMCRAFFQAFVQGFPP